MSTNLFNAVPRKITVGGKTNTVMAELVNWSGIALMVHLTPAHPRELKETAWTCSHERTGLAIALRDTPEKAVAAAIACIRAKHASFMQQTFAMPTLNS